MLFWLKMQLITFGCLVCGLLGSIAASFITPCHQTDLGCLKASSQHAVPLVAAGIPSMGMGSLDPMVIDEIKANQGGLEMDFRNTIVRGLRKCNVSEIRRLTHRTVVDLKCSVTLIGDYKLGGKLLVLPIEGEGKYKIKIHDIIVKVDLKIGEKLSEGKSYWTILDWGHTADVVGRVVFQFQNLFNGNSKLADPVLSFANSNWHDIFSEVAPPIVGVIVNRIVAELTKLFSKVPISDLALA